MENLQKGSKDKLIPLEVGFVLSEIQDIRRDNPKGADRILAERIAHLSSLAERDPLTGAYNRRGLEDRLVQLRSHAERTQEPLSIALIDIDNFKSINDRNGHGVGDGVLIHTVASLRERLRGQDVVARTGGDEFVLALPATSGKNAVTLMNRLKNEVPEDIHEAVMGMGLSLDVPPTLSIGVVEDDHSSDINSLFGKADKRLYRAKELGRNCVVGSDFNPE